MVIKNFKQIVTQDQELNEVQRNVFDSVTELQRVDFCNYYEVTGVSAIPNSTLVDINGPIFIPEGDFLIEFGASFYVTYGGNPSEIDARFNIVRVAEPNQLLLTDCLFTLASDHGSFSRSCVERRFLLQTRGENFQLKGSITVVSGSGVVRNIEGGYIKTTRRFI